MRSADKGRVHAGPTGEIKALTGLRFIAALWVALFHLTMLLLNIAPWGSVEYQPTLRYGYLGVDLFFVLSGYVMAHTYVDRIGERFGWQATAKFLWLRLARVWPVYFVTLILAGAFLLYCQWAGLRVHMRGDLSVSAFLEQVFMVQLWTRPALDGASWNEPAWSISAEWLAYLFFPVLVLLVWRMRWRLRVRASGLLAVAVTLPCALLMFSTGDFYSPYSWAPRIILQFAAGAIAYAAVGRAVVTLAMCRYAGWVATGLVVIIAGMMIMAEGHPAYAASPAYLRILFVPLVMAIAVGSTGLPRWLSWRPVVFGGHISYSLYLVHALVFNAVVAAAATHQFLPTGKDGPWLLFGAAMLLLSLLGAYVLWRWVEEPSRKAMRKGWPVVARTLSIDRPTRDTVPAPVTAPTKRSPAPDPGTVSVG